MAVIWKSCFSSKSRLAQRLTNSCYEDAPWRGAQYVTCIRLNLLLTVHAIGDFVACIFDPWTT